CSLKIRFGFHSHVLALAKDQRRFECLLRSTSSVALNVRDGVEAAACTGSDAMSASTSMSDFALTSINVVEGSGAAVASRP
ncbi:hypothetical protein, partial [Roseomonas sp. KE2513]|uniref:hypothetical protein n=1 Tax=Roseomonas sp. KE2513 TaxID=2479202 RepID=UPI001E63CFF0